MKINNTLISITLILSGLGWTWASRVRPSDTPKAEIQVPQQGFQAPDFVLDTLTGDQIALSDLRGKSVILNFWASWCPPCRAEMPAFQQGSEEFSDSPLIIIGVNATSQDSVKDAENFVEQHNLEFPILLDHNGSVGSAYQVRSLPATFFIDDQGIIKEIIVGGPIPLALLRVKADQLLQESSHVPNN